MTKYKLLKKYPGIPEKTAYTDKDVSALTFLNLMG